MIDKQTLDRAFDERFVPEIKAKLQAARVAVAGLLDADGADLTERDRVVTLSTCTAQDTVRLVVQGRLVYMEDT